MKLGLKMGIIFLLALSLIGLSGCVEKEVGTLEELVTASEVDEEYLPTTIASDFPPTIPVIYATGKVKDVPLGEKITADWYFVGKDGEVLIYGMELEVTVENMDFYFSLTKPTNNWDVGNYRIYFFIGNRLITHLNFKIS